MNRSSLFPTPVNSRIIASGSLDRRGTALQRLVRGERVVISRRHCHFESIPAPSGHRDARAMQAAKLAARARSPFQSASVKLVWSNNRIGIWSWPSDLLAPLENAEFQAVPETLLDSPADGEQLRRREGGYEGQVWRNGTLIASRWWDHNPSEEQWARFTRAVPISGQTEASSDDTAASDLGNLVGRIKDVAYGARPRDYAALAVVLILVPFMYLGGQWLRLNQQASAMQGELATLEESTADVVQARSEAMTTSAQLQSYAGLLETPHPAAAIAVFAEAAAGFEAELESFMVREGAIEIELSGNDNLPLASLVEQLEASDVLEGVRLEASNRANQWRIFATFEDEGDA